MSWVEWSKVDTNWYLTKGWFGSGFMSTMWFKDYLADWLKEDKPSTMWS